MKEAFEFLLRSNTRLSVSFESGGEVHWVISFLLWRYLFDSLTHSFNLKICCKIYEIKLEVNYEWKLFNNYNIVIIMLLILIRLITKNNYPQSISLNEFPEASQYISATLNRQHQYSEYFLSHFHDMRTATINCILLSLIFGREQLFLSSPQIFIPVLHLTSHQPAATRQLLCSYSPGFYFLQRLFYVTRSLVKTWELTVINEGFLIFSNFIFSKAKFALILHITFSKNSLILSNFL